MYTNGEVEDYKQFLSRLNSQYNTKVQEPKREYRVRNLKTGQFMLNSDGKKSWMTMTGATSRIKSLVETRYSGGHKTEDFRVEVYQLQLVDVFDPAEEFKKKAEEKKNLEHLNRAKNLFNNHKLAALNLARFKMAELVGLSLDFKQFKDLSISNNLRPDLCEKLLVLINKYECAESVLFEKHKDDYLNMVISSTINKNPWTSQ